MPGEAYPDRASYGEYLSLERRSDIKHEYVNGRVYAMAGGTPEHGRLAMTFGRLLGDALVGRPCAVFSSDVRVRVTATGRSTYPDLSVVCGKLEPAADDPDALTNPVVLVKVLSATTEAADRGDKFAHYRRLPSLEEYVLVAQDAPRVEVFRRHREAQGETWIMSELGPGQSVHLASLGVAFEVDELYHDPLAPAMPPTEPR